MKLIPHVKILHSDKAEVKHFGFQITHLIATKLNNGFIEVYIKWTSAPDFLKTLTSVNEGITQTLHGKFEELSTQTSNLSADFINITSFMELTFDEALYKIKDDEETETDEALTVVVALEQENVDTVYTPMFMHNRHWSCSVYFAPSNWEDHDEDPFVDIMFED